MTADDPLPPILVADDNPTDVFFLQRRLVHAGIAHPLEHVLDGVEAIRWLEQRLGPSTPSELRPWLVFIDLKMPRLDGFEVLQWMNSHGIGDQVTFVVLSTSDEPRDIERARRLGAHRYLVKYPHPADLFQVVSEAMRRSRMEAPEASLPLGKTTRPKHG